MEGQKAENLDKIGYPAITICAFTAELYFKCLLAILDYAIPNHHDLKKLFDALPPDIRKRIKELWDAQIWEQRRLKALRKLEDDVAKIGVPRTLEWALKSGSSAFEQARYLYEEEKPSLRFILSDLPAILRKVALEIQPDWHDSASPHS
jgi:hypothetical protein